MIYPFKIVIFPSHISLPEGTRTSHATVGLRQVDYALSPGITSPVRCRYPPFNPEEPIVEPRSSYGGFHPSIVPFKRLKGVPPKTLDGKGSPNLTWVLTRGTPMTQETTICRSFMIFQGLKKRREMATVGYGLPFD